MKAYLWPAGLIISAHGVAVVMTLISWGFSGLGAAWAAVSYGLFFTGAIASMFVETPDAHLRCKSLTDQAIVWGLVALSIQSVTMIVMFDLAVLHLNLSVWTGLAVAALSLVSLVMAVRALLSVQLTSAEEVAP